MEIKIGDLVDDLFRVDAFLGAGASGDVYRVSLESDWATHKVGTSFALKAYNDRIFEREDDTIVYSRRIREATVGEKVDSHNIIKTFDTSDLSENPERPRYLLMELVNGEQLDKWLTNNYPIPIEKIYDICLQISKGLHALHAKEIIHRDVKPPNVMITADGRLVLLDLGVVRALEEGTITGSESFLGTLRYGAPEWLLESDYSTRADVYSLGTIFYALLHGHDVFPEIRLFSRLVIAVEREVPKLSRISNDPRRAYLVDLVGKMLNKDPSKRPILDDVIGFLENRESNKNWKQIRAARIRELLPNLAFKGEGEDTIKILISGLNKIILDKVVSELNQAEFDTLVRLESVRAEIASLDSTGYLKLTERKRVEWLKRAFAIINAYEGSDSGDAIEKKWHLANRIKEIETSSTVILKLKPLLDEAEGAMDEMIQVWKQENP